MAAVATIDPPAEAPKDPAATGKAEGKADVKADGKGDAGGKAEGAGEEKKPTKARVVVARHREHRLELVTWAPRATATSS